jgi:hypothetical protein
LLLLANLPIAYAYYQIVISEITTNRYLFRNQSGAPVDDLTVIHQHRRIGFCRRLAQNRSVEFSFSALDNGGEGAISFTGQRGPQQIGGETGLMAFVFTKSHAEIILEPNGKYRVRIQEFTWGTPEGKPKQTEWDSVHRAPSRVN